MDHEVEPWEMAFFYGLTSWSNFRFEFFKKQFAKPLGPSIGINPMCTKRNDHAPKSECANFLNICLKRVV
jgi:hypothetical protein